VSSAVWPLVAFETNIFAEYRDTGNRLFSGDKSRSEPGHRLLVFAHSAPSDVRRHAKYSGEFAFPTSGLLTTPDFTTSDPVSRSHAFPAEAGVEAGSSAAAAAGRDEPRHPATASTVRRSMGASRKVPGPTILRGSRSSFRGRSHSRAQTCPGRASRLWSRRIHAWVSPPRDSIRNGQAARRKFGRRACGGLRAHPPERGTIGKAPVAKPDRPPPARGRMFLRSPPPRTRDCSARG